MLVQYGLWPYVCLLQVAVAEPVKRIFGTHGLPWLIVL